MFQRDFERNQGLNEIDLKLVNLKIDGVRCTAFIVYVFIILYITLFSREIGNAYIFKPLFWEYKKQMWRDIFLNMLLFVPFGLLVRTKKMQQGVLCGFLLSVLIELTQYFLRLGYCEPDDVLNNTIGTTIGVVAAYMIKRLRLICGKRVCKNEKV